MGNHVTAVAGAGEMKQAICTEAYPGIVPVLDCFCLAVQAVAGEQAESGGQDAGVVVEEEGKQCDEHAPQQSFLGTAHHHAHHNRALRCLGRAVWSRAPWGAAGAPSPPSAVVRVN